MNDKPKWRLVSPDLAERLRKDISAPWAYMRGSQYYVDDVPKLEQWLERQAATDAKDSKV
jgi:hypothetical protein